MVVSLLLVWCRLVLGMVFALSLIGKLRDIQAFRQAIRNFRLLPGGMIGIVSMLILGGELLVVLGITLGGRWLFPAFLLAMLVLIVFSAAMASVLARQIQTTCQCFGTSDKLVTVSDLWRNGGFLCCALSGCALTLWSPLEHTTLTMMAWFLAGVTATIFVAVWLRIGDVVALFQSP